MPEACREAFDEACARKDVTLAVDFVWRKFAKHAHRKRWRTHERLDRWADWVDREIVWTSRQAEERDAKATKAAVRARDHDAALAAERRQWDRDFDDSPAGRAKVLAEAEARARALGIAPPRSASA